MAMDESLGGGNLSERWAPILSSRRFGESDQACEHFSTDGRRPQSSTEKKQEKEIRRDMSEYGLPESLMDDMVRQVRVAGPMGALGKQLVPV